MKYLIYISFFTCFLSLNIGVAQTPQDTLGHTKEDTVWIKGRSVLILGDTSIFVDKDTIFVLPDTVAVFLKEDTVRRSNRFYKKIKKALYKTTVTTELYHLLFDEPEPTVRVKKKKSLNQSKTFEEHIGKIIQDVKIEKLAVFGTNINDTSQLNRSSYLVRLGNKFHNYTRTGIIKNHLFFSEGQLLDPVELEDSERILRSLPYIQDARILVDSLNPDAVQVTVVVKDNWSLYPQGQIFDTDRYRFSLLEQNFLGLGHQFSNQIRYDQSNSPRVGYVGNYSFTDIKNTFITANINYAQTDDFMRRGVEVFRNFITPDITWAGGVEVSLNGHEIKRLVEDSVVEFDTRFQFQDVWLARAYPVGVAEKRKRLVTGFRFVNYNYLSQPQVTPDSNYQFFSRDQYLFNVGLSKREYEKSTLIYGYGRTEDIPIGYTFGLTAGKEYNQFYDRWYSGLNYAVGGYLGRLGYFRPRLTLGSFLRNGDFEQGILKVELNYFSLLYQIRRFAFRQFFYLNFTEGFNRYGNEFISINDREGVRGLRSVQLQGTKRWVFRSETLSFTPFYIVGFRMAIFAFADLAAIQKDGENLFDAKIYQGYGIGIRLRNENLAIKSFLIRFGFYPNPPDDTVPYDFDVDNNIADRPRDFDINRPRILDFF
ncbi:MAG: hypothetical protein ACNS60_08895 [Candidatus Cyclobacteriaceae bacterium M2_1C_046]